MGRPRTNMSFHIACIAKFLPLYVYEIVSRDLGAAAMPVSVKLKGARGLNHRGVVSRAGHELQADWKISFGEAAGNRKRGETAQIADAALRVCERQFGFKIGLQRCGGDRLRHRDEHVKGIE